MKLALHAGDGDKKPDRREEHGISRSNHRAGNAGVIGEPVVTTRVLSTFAREAAGAPDAPAFPAPSVCEGGNFSQNSRG